MFKSDMDRQERVGGGVRDGKDLGRSPTLFVVVVTRSLARFFDPFQTSRVAVLGSFPETSVISASGPQSFGHW